MFPQNDAVVDPKKAETKICQRRPAAFNNGQHGCTSRCCSAIIYIRRAGTPVPKGDHKVTIYRSRVVGWRSKWHGYNHQGSYLWSRWRCTRPWIGWSGQHGTSSNYNSGTRPTIAITELQKRHNGQWLQIGKGKVPPRTIRSVAHSWSDEWDEEINAYTFSFRKFRDDTPLRVTWFDTFRCFHGSGKRCSWSVRIDGSNCRMMRRKIPTIIGSQWAGQIIVEQRGRNVRAE